MYLALNPNLTTAQFNELAEQRAKNSQQLQEIFTENLAKIESPEQKANYISACMPILIMNMF